MRILPNQRIQIQCQECSGADLIMRFSGCRKVAQTKRSAWLSANLHELFTRTRTETPGLERPFQRSIIFSAKNVLDIYCLGQSVQKLYLDIYQ